MLSVPKQQSHKRELPSMFEGNKQAEQQGPTTTFKNWAAEVQIYMSLADHKLATIMEDVKKHSTTRHTITYDETDLEQHNTITKRVHSTFQNWREEIFNYVCTVQAERATSMKM
eukprot:6296762-Amphidinium_carterae.1